MEDSTIKTGLDCGSMNLSTPPHPRVSSNRKHKVLGPAWEGSGLVKVVEGEREKRQIPQVGEMTVS